MVKRHILLLRETPVEHRSMFHEFPRFLWITVLIKVGRQPLPVPNYYILVKVNKY